MFLLDIVKMTRGKKISEIYVIDILQLNNITFLFNIIKCQLCKYNIAHRIKNLYHV